MPVLIIGPQRTGTSLIAGILQRLGVDMCVNPISPNGDYYESDEWMKVCGDICGDWHCPQIHFTSSESAQAITKLAEKRKGELWGAKTPFFPLIGHILIPLIQDVRVIRTTRNLDTTIKSLMRRDIGMQEGVATYIQQQAFAACILTDKICAKQKTPTVIIKYDDLLAEPRKIVQAISDFVLDKPVDIAKAVGFVNPALSHFKEAA